MIYDSLQNGILLYYTQLQITHLEWFAFLKVILVKRMHILNRKKKSQWHIPDSAYKLYAVIHSRHSRDKDVCSQLKAHILPVLDKFRHVMPPFCSTHNEPAPFPPLWLTTVFVKAHTTPHKKTVCLWVRVCPCMSMWLCICVCLCVCPCLHVTFMYVHVHVEVWPNK